MNKGKPLKKILLSLLCCTSFLYAWDYTSLYDTFRGGARHQAMGFTGGAFTNGMSSIYYNPAHVSRVGRIKDVQFMTSSSLDFAAPGLGINLLRTDFSLGYFNYDIIPNWDFGLSYTFNRANFRAGSRSIIIEDEKEFSHLYTLGATYKEVVSLGYLINRIRVDQSIKSVNDNNPYATIGIIGAMFHPVIEQSNDQYINPSFGVTYTGLDDGAIGLHFENDDSTYTSYYNLPREFRFAFSLDRQKHKRFSHVHSVDFTLPVNPSKDNSPSIAVGQSYTIAQILSLSHGGYLHKGHQRKEYHLGTELNFNYQQMAKVFNYTPKKDYNITCSYGFAFGFSFGDNSIRSRKNMHEVTFGFSLAKKK